MQMAILRTDGQMESMQENVVRLSISPALALPHTRVHHRATHHRDRSHEAHMSVKYDDRCAHSIP
jgi:hypothetical protein